MRDSEHLRQMLWRHQRIGGFESALAEVQANFTRDPQNHTHHMQALQSAVSQMFGHMNRAFFEANDFEFQQHADRMLRTFLVKFDAIFTLNQDLLLEHHYLGDNIALTAPERWNGPQLPGLRPSPGGPVHPVARNFARFFWSPVPQVEFRVEPRLQPLFKLHGSTNWHDPVAGPMMILGDNKRRDIQFHPILSWYFTQFETLLSQPDTRLMIVGYGFRDQHVNEVIVNAVARHDLKIFVVDPNGADIAKNLNPTHGAQIRGPETPLEEAFSRGLIGASRRGLREIFGSDSVEHHKVQRFFDA